MLKKFIIALFALCFITASAWAAPANSVAGKITAIDGTKVQLTLEGERPAWVRKGLVVKLGNEAGEAIDQTAKVTEVGDSGITLTTNQAGEVKVGDAVTLQKGRARTGC